MNLSLEDSKQFIQFHRPSIGESEISEVVDTLRSGWLTTGPKTKLFEENFKAYIGCDHAVAVSSCTAGLHLSLVALNIGPGDEVITSPYTFASTAAVILHVGARPVFVDIEKEGFNIDVERIEKAVSHTTRAIIPVHFSGEPCKMKDILDVAKRYNLSIIEDAAHAVGAQYHDKAIGTIGNLTVFSFYATKNITTGEGGMVTTNDAELADKIRLGSLHGISKNAWKRYTSEGTWYYEILWPGFKYNMTDIQAAIGIQQLNKLEDFIKMRENLANYYSKLLQEVPLIQTPRSPDGIKHAWHLYVIRLKDKLIQSRNLIIERLNTEGIGTSVHFIPLHLHPYYKSKFGYRRGDFPNAEQTFESAISLPLYPEMSRSQVERVVDRLRRIINQLLG